MITSPEVARASGTPAWVPPERGRRERTCVVQVLTIFFRSGLAIERVKELFHERAGRYRGLRGLRQRYYVRDTTTGQVGGVYVFDRPEDVEAFRGSDLERSIALTYQVRQPAATRVLDVLDLLHPEPGVEGAADAHVFRHVVDEGFNRGNIDALDALFAPGYVEHDVGIRPPSVDGLKTFVRTLRSAFPDLRLTIDAASSGGGLTWTRTTARGTHAGPFMGLAPTGRHFSATWFDTCRIEQGRIAEHWGVIDWMSVLEQLGGRVAAAPLEPSAAR